MAVAQLLMLCHPVSRSSYTSTAAGNLLPSSRNGYSMNFKNWVLILILLTFSSGAAEKLDPALHLLQAISSFNLGLGTTKGVASDGTNYLVAWQSATSNELEIGRAHV